MTSPAKDPQSRPPENASAEEWQRYAQELEGVVTSTERRAHYLQDQLNGVVNSPGWKLLRRLRDTAHAVLRPFPRARKMIGVFAREGPGGVVRRLREGSIGDAAYEAFLKRHPFDDAARASLKARLAALPDSQKPLISVIVPVYNTPADLLKEAVESVRAQIYENWELCLVDDKSPQEHVRPLLEEFANKDRRIRVKFRETNGNISRASQDGVEMARGPFVAFLDHDDVLTPDALAEVALLLAQHPDTDFIYSDHDMLEMSGRRSQAFFKPDWSLDMMLSNMYVCHLTVFRTELVKKVGGLREGFEGSQDYDLVLRIAEASSHERIRHIPKVLYSWRRVPGSTAHRYSAKGYADQAARKAIAESLQRRGVKAEVHSGTMPSLFRVKYQIQWEPLVSILIPFRDKAELLERCVRSIREKTSYRNYEFILIDNGSQTAEMKSLLEREARQPNTRVLRIDEPFNFSRLNNLAAKEAKGEHLLLLNNDTEAIDGEWLSAMLEHSQRPEVGAVGAKLLYPDNRVQHAGVIIGIGEVAGHSHRMVPAEDPGYFGILQMIRNYSAVTGACLMTKKKIYEELGGLNETDLAVAYNDVDYCLRLRQRGLLIVYTPYAKLYHHESVSRGFTNNPRESGYMCRRWAKYFNDPYYNPNLNRNAEDFSLGQ
ncbi:MAG TPA: glycosyltransferase family 2 protein [Planctomycetota bacterium]|nr:glycosyltransferase family 2 protein [Planctomycetota bacterium]